MDYTSSLFQLQDSSAFLFDCENLLDQSYATSDAGYHSACSSLSPASSTDCCFSPPTLHCGSGQEHFSENILECFPVNFSLESTNDQEEKKKAKPAKRTGRPRSKFPGIKRQSASEREKMRMRDLTKALHYLRTYLPPSVAPAGQTLTKIETLRLAIRYISHLSAQLELSQGQFSQASLPGSSGQIEATSLHSENFEQDSPAAQSFSAQVFQNMASYQNADCSLTPSPVEVFWFPQQQCGYYGQS